MPTDQEKLAIAEEIAACHNTSIQLSDMYVHRGNAGWYAQAEKGKTHWVAQHESLIECIYAARQKLAAEKEAARTPEERRLRDKIADIREYVSDGGKWDKTILRLCNEALEQGT